MVRASPRKKMVPDALEEHSYVYSYGHFLTVLAVVIIVFVCVIGGVQRQLPERQFGKVSVSELGFRDKRATVTQASSKGTAVTLNDRHGRVTMNGAALNDTIVVSFTVNCDKVSAGDIVLARHVSAGTVGAYLVGANTITDGSFNVTVKNVSGGNLSQAIVIDFDIFGVKL